MIHLTKEAAQQVLYGAGHFDDAEANDKACDIMQAAIEATEQDDLTNWKVRALQAEAVIKKFMEPEQQPMFWVRLCSDGLYEGPIHNARIEGVRRQSGAWSPLFLAPPVPQAPNQSP